MSWARSKNDPWESKAGIICTGTNLVPLAESRCSGGLARAEGLSQVQVICMALRA